MEIPEFNQKEALIEAKNNFMNLRKKILNTIMIITLSNGAAAVINIFIASFNIKHNNQLYASINAAFAIDNVLYYFYTIPKFITSYNKAIETIKYIDEDLEFINTLSEIKSKMKTLNNK